MAAKTMLNKDYWYLLPIRYGQSVYKVTIAKESGSTRLLVQKGVVTAPEHLDIEMPMSRENLLHEQNIDWEPPVHIKNIGEPDERACGVIFPEINPASAYSDAGWRPQVETVLQFVRTLGNKRQSLPFLYVGVRKRFDISAVLRPWIWPYLCWCSNYYPGPEEVELLLTGFGYRNVERYSVIDQGNDREEVLLEARYQSSENLLGLRGRVKDWILRGKGFSRFSSAFSLVAQESREPCVAEKICNELNRDGSGITQIGKAVAPKKLISLLLPRKVILYVGDPQATRAIIVISRMKQVEERRKREAQMLVHLENNGLTGIVKSPRFLGSGDWEGAKFFVQEAKPGTAIDMNQWGLATVQRRAFELIHEFHVQTKTAVQIGEENYHDNVGWILTAGLEKYAETSSFSDTLRQVDAAIRKYLMGKTIYLAWMHGDYKIENMMVDPGTRQIEGVIDWEHAREIGIPSIDIWYLILYNRFLVGHRGILDLFTEVCLEGHTNREEARMLDKHNRAFDYGMSLEKIMKSLFVLHHVCCRMTYDLADRDFRQGIESLMNNTRRYLEEKK